MKSFLKPVLLTLFCLTALMGCYGEDDKNVDPDSGLVESDGATACTYTPFQGAQKKCSNLSKTYCTKYSYSTIGDETHYAHSRCSDLGY
jgi:hypothetical protein